MVSGVHFENVEFEPVRKSWDVLFDYSMHTQLKYQRVNSQKLSQIWVSMNSTHQFTQNAFEMLYAEWQPFYSGLIVLTHKQLETHGCMLNTQHCSYWWPGAKAPGHQYAQCWLNILCVGPV